MNITETQAIAAGLFAASGFIYGAFKAGQCKGLKEAIKYQNTYVQFIIVTSLCSVHGLQKVKPTKSRTFKTHGNKKFRIGVAERAKVSKNGVSFDLDRCFQFHYHIGRYSVYLSFSPLLVWENQDEWYGKNVVIN